MFAGSVTVVVMEPVVETAPLLVMVTGRLLATVACSAGAGWPMTVVRSGTAAAPFAKVKNSPLAKFLLSHSVMLSHQEPGMPTRAC